MKLTWIFLIFALAIGCEKSAITPSSAGSPSSYSLSSALSPPSDLKNWNFSMGSAFWTEYFKHTSVTSSFASNNYDYQGPGDNGIVTLTNQTQLVLMQKYEIRYDVDILDDPAIVRLGVFEIDTNGIRNIEYQGTAKDSSDTYIDTFTVTRALSRVSFRVADVAFAPDSTHVTLDNIILRKI